MYSIFLQFSSFKSCRDVHNDLWNLNRSSWQISLKDLRGAWQPGIHLIQPRMHSSRPHMHSIQPWSFKTEVQHPYTISSHCTYRFLSALRFGLETKITAAAILHIEGRALLDGEKKGYGMFICCLSLPCSISNCCRSLYLQSVRSICLLKYILSIWRMRSAYCLVNLQYLDNNHRVFAGQIGMLIGQEKPFFETFFTEKESIMSVERRLDDLLCYIHGKALC